MLNWDDILDTVSALIFRITGDLLSLSCIQIAGDSLK